MTLAQLRAHGVGDGAVKHQVATGRLIRLHRGVYAVGHAALRQQAQWLAAVLACGVGAALSHGSAAAHRGLWRRSGSRIDVTAPRARGPRPGIAIHRPRVLPAGDVTDHHGIPTTTPTRILIDLAPRLSPDALEALAAAAETRDLIDYARIDEAAPQRLKTILGRGARYTRSHLERLFLAGVRAAGLPEPEMNVWMTHGGGEQWQADALYRRERVIVELDGGHHRTRHAFELDRRKDAVRQASGYRTLRFTYRQVTDDLPSVISVLTQTLALTRAARGVR